MRTVQEVSRLSVRGSGGDLNSLISIRNTGQVFNFYLLTFYIQSLKCKSLRSLRSLRVVLIQGNAGVINFIVLTRRNITINAHL